MAAGGGGVLGVHPSRENRVVWPQQTIPNHSLLFSPYCLTPIYCLQSIVIKNIPIVIKNIPIVIKIIPIVSKSFLLLLPRTVLEARDVKLTFHSYCLYKPFLLLLTIIPNVFKIIPIVLKNADAALF